MTDQKPRRKWRNRTANPVNPAARITRKRLRKGWKRLDGWL